MIDDALCGRAHGLGGWAYIDRRGIEHGAYALGDFWLAEAAERLAREGYDVIEDAADPVWGAGLPDGACRVLPGLVQRAGGRARFSGRASAFSPAPSPTTFTPASAAILRTATEHWAGPLLAAGAAATMGCVGEPLLKLTPHLSLFTDRYAAGSRSGRARTWPNPCSRGRSPSWATRCTGLSGSAAEELAAQTNDAEAAGWARVRWINQLVRMGRFNVALDLCRRWIAETGQPGAAREAGRTVCPKRPVP